MRIQRVALCRRCRQVVIPFLFRCYRAPLDEADHFVQHAGVAGDLQVAACALGQPEIIVRAAGAYAATLRRVPPVHHIAFGELVCSAQQQVFAGQVRARVYQGERVLQLVAEAERAA
ncbi:hypothetical protein D3C81_720280 [compost metagenome]